MVCRHMRMGAPDRASFEWVPPALQDATCLLRRSDPHRWVGVLRMHGYDVEDGNCCCLHNATATWPRCPLYAGPGALHDPGDRVARNEFGIPLII